MSEFHSTNEIAEHETMMFTCVANGFPTPNIVWLHNFSFVFPTSRRQITTDTVESTNHDNVPLAVRSTLTVSQLKLRDSGVYMCRVDPSDIFGGSSDFSNAMNLYIDPG